MENKTIEQIVGRINSLLGTKSLTSAEEWIDVAMDLQLLRYSEGIRRLALEIAANKKRKEIRGTANSVADAELELKTTDEYEAWQKQEVLINDLDNFERIARKESEIRRKGFN